MSRRVKFSAEARLSTVNYADAAVDTSDLSIHVANEAEPPTFSLIQGDIPTLNRPLSEHLSIISLGSTRPRRRPVEPGPPDSHRVSVGPSEPAQEGRQHDIDNRDLPNRDGDESSSTDSDDSDASPPNPAPKPLPSVNIPFVLDRFSASYNGNAPGWYVVTEGKVVGVFCDRDFVKRVYAPGRGVPKFDDFDEARRYYDQQKRHQKLRIIRSGNDDDRLYGNIAYAVI
ncbi:hypothetical protein BKA70DRAFT_1428180 [Coprinopsis sp. MPI-PUGE-AT-0042]|nr:hypothetical protein BKA70DRAFT_1428180 [Coprinopsis sp. MPI-PUGE-AT-0042]